MKTKTIIIIMSLTLSIMLLAANGFSDVPAPPVNQSIGMADVTIGSLTEADCRICHFFPMNDRHHLLYGSLIPSLSVVPYPEANDTIYVCLSCHDDEFNVVTNCTECHNTSSPHHQNAAADAGDCVACHGDLVDNMDDGHYIPSYAPSLVTPKSRDGEGEVAYENSRGNATGGCNYCHDNDGQAEPTILTNFDLHHGINLVDFGNRCDWCHDDSFSSNIRKCEGCHGPESLHSIQADTNGDNVITPGGELAGYGHVGTASGPGGDCWGCHGFVIRQAHLAPAR
jgi:hypothetical protein